MRGSIVLLLLLVSYACSSDQKDRGDPTAEIDVTEEAIASAGATSSAGASAGEAASQNVAALTGDDVVTSGAASDDDVGAASKLDAGGPANDDSGEGVSQGEEAMGAEVEHTADASAAVHGEQESEALTALAEYLAVPREGRAVISEQAFAQNALSAEEAVHAKELLWQAHTEWVRQTRQEEVEDRAITIGEHTLRYDYTTFGEADAGGRSLYISLHGGGNAEASVNDGQWENQKLLYEPEEGIYLSPRAPTNTWNLWHENHIDPLFQRLISNMVVFEGVDVNRVYIMGYSAGGDGVYQLAPRMADRWAAAAMMAGHPNESQPDGLRNIGFTIHVGADDSAYDRNLVAAEWGDQLAALNASDPEGYSHEVYVHAGKGHWMDLEDAVAVPWMAEFRRSSAPDVVVWLQDDTTHEQFYWLAVPAGQAAAGDLVRASYVGQAITLESLEVSELSVRLSDAMLDLDQELTISAGGQELFRGTVSRTIATLALTLEEREDIELAFSAEVHVTLP